MSTTDREHGGQPRNGDGQWIKGVDSYERDAEALRMRARNCTLQEISDTLGYGGRSNAQRALRAATERIEKPAVDHYRQVMDAQLDELEHRAQAVLDARHLVFHQGRPVRLCAEHPESCTEACGEVVDDGPVLAAVASLLKIQERRARLWGTDAPVRAEVEQSGSVRYVVEGVDMEKLR